MLRTHLIFLIIAFGFFVISVAESSEVSISTFLSMFVFYHLVLKTAAAEKDQKENLVERNRFIFRKLIPTLLIFCGGFALYFTGKQFFDDPDISILRIMFNSVYLLILGYCIYLLIAKKAGTV